MSSLRILAVHAAGIALANAQAGIREHGGNNLGYQVTRWQRLAGGDPGESWCQDFAFSMYLKASADMKNLLTGATADANFAAMLAHIHDFAVNTGIIRTGSCQAQLDAQKALGRTHGHDFDPSPGDQVFFDMPVGGHTLGHAHHTGIVLAVLSNGHIQTVEGNTSSGVAGSQGDGDGVFVRERGRDFVYGFAHYA